MVVRCGCGSLMARIWTFSALSVEPYGGSAPSRPICCLRPRFQCSLCRAVWWFPGRMTITTDYELFQCSLCRAVWWFNAGTPCVLCEECSFSALSVEPYGGSRADRLQVRTVYPFQCSLCRAVWWFRIWPAMTPQTYFSFSALSVEPYGGSRHHPRNERTPGLFQCSLCRAVWWFKAQERLNTVSRQSFSALSVEPYGGSSPTITVN